MLDILITSKTRRKLVIFFALNKGRQFYLRELAKEIGESVHAVRLERDTLGDLEVIRIHALRRLIDPRAKQCRRGWASLERDMTKRIELLRTLFDRIGVPLA